jgi:hypothetical protein
MDKIRLGVHITAVKVNGKIVDRLYTQIGPKATAESCIEFFTSPLYTRLWNKVYGEGKWEVTDEGTTNIR